MQRLMILILALITTACSTTVGAPVSYEVIEEPVSFYFDTDPRDQARVQKIAEALEPHFPEMTWRIGTYDPSERDGIVVLVEERLLRDADPECVNCSRSVTAFVVFDRGRRLGIEEFEDCSIFRVGGDCFAVRQLVSTIDVLVADARSGPVTVDV